jgi:hypothetical protein
VISLKFNFFKFIDEIKNKDKNMILNLAESEMRQAEKIAEIKGYGQDYVEALNGFIYFLRYQQKPYSIKEEHFKMIKIVCENLVIKKQISSDLLKMFD